MDTKSHEKLLLLEATIDANNKKADKNQVKTDEKLKIITENLQKLTSFMMDQTKMSKSSPAQKDTLNPT